jgi:hypothetical protein
LKILGAGVVAGLWPLYHALNGGILQKTGGNFSIKVNGVMDSFRIAVSGFIPRFGFQYDSRLDAYLLVGGIVGAFVITLYGILRKTMIDGGLNLIVLRLSLLLSCFLGLVAMVDLFSPMSRSRNYIVLLPIVTLLIAGIIQLVSQHVTKLKNPLLFLVCVYGALALLTSYEGITRKVNSQENWKAASQFIVKNFRGENLYFVKEDYRVWSANEVDESWRELIANFYLKKESEGRLSASPFAIGETAIKRPAAILYGHNPRSFKKLSEEMKQYDAIQVFPFSGDSDGHAVGVFLLK